MANGKAGDGDQGGSRLRRVDVSLFESSMNTIGISRFGSLFLGFLAFFLVLASGRLTETEAAGAFFWAVIIMMIVLALAILFRDEAHPGLGNWGIIGLFFVGAAMGIWLYHYRIRLWGNVGNDLWTRYRSLGAMEDVVLAALFGFGIIMGVFVVRIWDKKEEDFVKSVTASLGSAAIPPLLAKTLNVNADHAFGAYFLGFTLSASANIIYCARLISNYSNKHSLDSRTVLDYMYGKDKAKAVDHYFLENFSENQDTVKLLLINTLKAYREEVKKGYAARMEARRAFEKQGVLQSPPQSAHKRQYYYELVAIFQNMNGSNQSPPHSDDEYEVEFRKLKETEPITAKMFRLGIIVKWLQSLEYILAAGTYTEPLPLDKSVAGLALQARRVIVMYRDAYKRVRTGDAPHDLEQGRKLKEIDYLSYVSVPIVSDLGYIQEEELGVVNVDTRLFTTEFPLEEDDLKEKKLIDENTWRMTITLNELREKANNLYDEHDICVEFLDSVKSIIEPLLRLYLICRQGSK